MIALYMANFNLLDKPALFLSDYFEREVLPRFSTRRQENAQALMQYIYKVPALDIKRVSNLLDIKANTAATLVNDFVKYGVLYELTGKQRNVTIKPFL